MNKISLFASVIAVSMGMASLFHTNRQLKILSVNENISHATDGAFRDGLYLGTLAAESGVAPGVVAGRWATEADRASFTAGYLRGYEEFLAKRGTH